MSPELHPASDSDLKLVAALASAVSLLFFLYYFQRGEILLYGDAIAHINIARRVFDSQTPGLLQLGTVWLPLPHLLMIPFLVSNWMWRTGVGGSIPSMIAYVAGVMGIFRLTRSLWQENDRKQPAARAGAWLAALVFGTNPNLIYLQTTAMTEPLYLTLFIWTVVYFSDFLRWLRLKTAEATDYSVLRRPLYRCAGCLAAAELTRYDGWFLAAATAATVLALLLPRWRDRELRRAAMKFLVCIAAAPLLWLAYNAAVYGNPLEFANGPYSAKAIEQRTAQPGYPAHPGAGSIPIAVSFFLKAAELNMATGIWGRIWIAVALAGLVIAMNLRSRPAFLLLGVPLIFYALSIAYGGVPLFLPAWWPFTWYNLRYGLQLLPLFAVSTALIVSVIASLMAPSGGGGRLFRASFAAIAVIVVLSYFFVWKAQPLCFKEAWVNSRSKLALESAVAQAVTTLPADTRYLMYLGDHVGVFQQAGVPLRQVINEGNHRPWKKPADSDGLWEQALAHPTRFVDVVIAYEGDAVDQAVEKEGLSLVKEIHTLGQPRARIFTVRPDLNQSR